MTNLVSAKKKMINLSHDEEYLPFLKYFQFFKLIQTMTTINKFTLAELCERIIDLESLIRRKMVLQHVRVSYPPSH